VPIYEYECDACHQRFEILQKISDPLKTQCPSCKEEKLRKRVSAAAFRLKGGGWYETDFKDKKSQKNISGGETTSSTSSDSSSSGGSESKSTTADKPAESKPAASSTTTKTTE
jgi:putative FmdB family regulatory protein